MVHQHQWWLFSLWRFWRNYSSSPNCQCVSSLWPGLSKQILQKLRAPTPSDRHCIETCFSFLTLVNQGLNCEYQASNLEKPFGDLQWLSLYSFPAWKTDWGKTRDRPMVLGPLTPSQGTSKFNLLLMREGIPIFVTMGDLASLWAIGYNGETFDNLISQQRKFYIGMHYRYQLLYVLNVINSFCISSMLYSIDQ